MYKNAYVIWGKGEGKTNIRKKTTKTFTETEVEKQTKLNFK